MGSTLAALKLDDFDEALKNISGLLDQLRGKLVGLLQAPATRLATVLQAPAGQLARVLMAYSESSSGAAEPAQ